MWNMPSKKKRPDAPALRWQTTTAQAPGSRDGHPIWEDRQHVEQFAETDGVPWRVETTWAVRGGRPEPIIVTVHAPERDRPVLGKTIRRLPFGQLQQEARRDATRMETIFKTRAGDAGGEARQLYQELGTAFGEIAGSHQGRRASQAELEEIAAVYTEAWGKGDPVTEAVAKHFHIAPSTAAKRIMATRKAGLLAHIKRIRRS
jgi:hypothetical protein